MSLLEAEALEVLVVAVVALVGLGWALISLCLVIPHTQLLLVLAELALQTILVLTAVILCFLQLLLLEAVVVNRVLVPVAAAEETVVQGAVLAVKAVR